MKILITGARGFIGRNLAEYFAPNHDVFAYGRDELDLEDADAVYRCLVENHFNLVIHAAGYDENSPVTKRPHDCAFEKNMRMYTNLTRWSGIYDKMIYFGSASEVDKNKRSLNMTELECRAFIPSDSYGLSKYLMNSDTHNIRNVTNVRLFGVFGKYDDWRYRVIPNLCAQALYFDELTLKRNAVHDFMFIGDLAKAVDLIGRNPEVRSNAYNVCPGEPVTFRHLADIVRKVSGKKLGIKCPDEYYHSYSGDNSLFLSHYKTMGFTPMEEAIWSLYAYYQVHQSAIPKDEVMRWL